MIGEHGSDSFFFTLQVNIRKSISSVVFSVSTVGCDLLNLADSVKLHVLQCPLCISL